MDTHKIEIRRRNAEKVLLTAEKVFAERGYAGTFMGNIAEETELPRSNLRCYFSTKDELYHDVFLGLFEVWKQDAPYFEMFDDPRAILTSYIRAKVNHSHTRPRGSKVWANEIMHGAPLLDVIPDDSLYEWAEMKEAEIRQWVEERRILPIEPNSLLHMTWASTQHYADFGYQVEVFNGHQPLSDMQLERTVQTVTSMVLRGVGLEP